MSDWQSLSEQLDTDDSERWEHVEGDRLLGTLVELGSWSGEFGDSLTVTVETAPGSTSNGEPIKAGERRILYASRTVLAKKLEELEPKVGDRLGVLYKGLVAGGANEYHGYSVRVSRRAPTPAAAQSESGADPSTAEERPLFSDDGS